MRRILVLLMIAVLLGGCGATEPGAAVESVPETQPGPVRFPDGDPDTAACLGSYTASEATDKAAAQVGEKKLTNRELQVWYWAEVARYRLSGGEGLDESLPLDGQACPIDDSVATWQQYFLKQALNTWHTTQALLLQGQEEGVPSGDPTYAPTPGNYEKYMTGMPAAKVLYGYEKSFQPNSMHQAFLDGLPEYTETVAQELGYQNAAEMARKALGANKKHLMTFAREYNLAYMYFTSLTYLLEAEAPPQEASGENLVTFRHILFTDDMALGTAWDVWSEWDGSWLSSESTFASLAFEHSQDKGSAGKGGLYRRVSRDQLPEELAQWCFDGERQPGDSGVVETGYGAHVVYLVESEDREAVRTEERLLREQAQGLLRTAREKYPMEAFYKDIVLVQAEGTMDPDAVLYPDVAHERFPDVPLFLQQDYPGVMYGGYKLQTNGCGITSFAMIASYMADEEYTPPYMCAEFGRYSSVSGTDSGIFRKEGGMFNCFQIFSTYNWEEARDYVKEGYPAIVLQHAGYWTRGGHYLVLEKMDEDGQVQVRDSNLYNYSRIRDGHLTDRFSWDIIHRNSSGYWVFAKKDVTTLACTRCGTGADLCSGYQCPKCTGAVMRRDVYLTGV